MSPVVSGIVRLIEAAALMQARADTRDVVSDAIVAKLNLDTARKVYSHALDMVAPYDFGAGFWLATDIPTMDLRNLFFQCRSGIIVAGVPPLRPVH